MSKRTITGLDLYAPAEPFQLEFSHHANPARSNPARSNRFLLAHQRRGTLSQKAERWLNVRLENYGSERFNEWRRAVGIAPNTPNRLLSASQAFSLSEYISMVARGDWL